MTSIKDVARQAGVSVGTVSNFFNRPERVKQETKARIARVVADMNYVPNPMAQVVRSGVSNTIAVVMPNLTNTFYAELYTSIKRSLSEHGYMPAFYTLQEDLEYLESYLTNLSSLYIGGAILCYIPRKAWKKP